MSARSRDKRGQAPASPPLGLSDLGRLRRQLQEAEARRAETRRLEAAREAALQREANVFREAVADVQPLVTARRVERPKTEVEPIARQFLSDERQALAETLSDEIDIERRLEHDEALSFRRPGISQEALAKLRRGHWVVQAALDLHGLRRDEARDRLAAFVRKASRAGLRCVRIVHGKGNGSPGRAPVLKEKVRAWLVQKNEVMAFVQARASEGGHGALVVLLGTAAAPTPAPSRERR